MKHGVDLNVGQAVPSFDTGGARVHAV